MIPSLLAKDVAESLREFIVTGFETETWPFAGKFEQLVSNQNGGEAFIKGPYVSISLPFAKTSDKLDFFPGFKTEHSPFVHQEQAWSRLRSDGGPLSTIVATGTGSGKTECFLYPLLDHCLRHQREPGIKAIIIYPMNALAGDQAKRFAEVVHSTPEFKGKIRVGLFVGGESDEKHMGENHVITSKDALRKNPPDILLTNYKMLDYLLMRPKDQGLWLHNSPDTLRYLVVDELHTFDGAQGSDLAMLLRRLKARLKIDSGQLVCVGTSATLGSDSRIDELAEYASNIFDTVFDRSSIIGESRQTHEQFLGMIEYMLLDPSFTPDDLKVERYQSINDYLATQARLFFGDDFRLEPAELHSRVELGRRLRKHPMLHNLLYLSRKGPVAIDELIPAIQKQVPSHLRTESANVVVSLLSLLSHARGERYPGEPFVTLRIQLWVRELRRIVSRVGNDSVHSPVYLQFSDDLKAPAANQKPTDIFLPAVQCNECHTTAWLTCLEQGESHIVQDLRQVYTRFFASDRHVKVLLPLENKQMKPPSRGVVRFLCSCCGHLQNKEGQCISCNEQALVMVFDADLNKSTRDRDGINSIESQRFCPVCQAKSSLILFGARAASLCSVAIHQMFANPNNDDKKLIAFSDSVQDAAHRAGFFSARTWQNNVRMSISKALHHYRERHGHDIGLVDFFDFMQAFWLNNADNPESFTSTEFIVQLIAPNMQTHEDYASLEKGELAKPGRLIDQVQRRLKWETIAELGIRSSIGRSLERTGVASLSWNPALIDHSAAFLLEGCREKLGHNYQVDDLKHLLWGIALRMKRQGAIFDPLLSGFIENGGDWYFLSRKNLSFMPDIGNYSILPRFPAEASEKGLERLLPENHTNWYTRWAQQFIASDSLVDNQFVRDLLQLVMQSLCSSGLLLDVKTRKGNTVWCINPAVLRVSTKLASLRLRQQSGMNADNRIYGSWYIPQEWTDCLVGMPSLEQLNEQKHFSPVYEINPSPRHSMFRDFFLNGEIQRVIGKEHTALLERHAREELENRFMAKADQRQPWYENLLSATPTLEMGIDIGDLSSVLLCSVPPGQSNYLQRAGRGGRRDGNSFVMTLANGHPHDLYFYADPVKMLAGDVQAPAIYLNAIMVLKRQLLAFCFDQWGMSMNGNHDMPERMQAVLDAVENADTKKFPFTLLDYINKNRDELWDGFEHILSHQVLAFTRDKLKSYLLGTNSAEHEEQDLRIYVLSRIKEMTEERKSIIRHQKDLEKELKLLKNQPQDDVRDKTESELVTEIEGFKRLKYELNKKETLNFFTDDGLLPNYAFPEEGTILKSVIYRKLSQPKPIEGGATNFDSKIFEYTRPAHAALSELVPESIFYASNRKVKIERIEMANGKNLEYWRLCPSCNYSELLIGPEQPVCPRCNDPMWANVSQKMPMVRLRQVYANTREEDAFIGDDSDTREPTFYNRQMLIDFDRANIDLAYALKTEGKPFGFEFIKKATFREINFGKQGGSDQMFSVAGKEIARPGFRLCKECGMVQQGKKSLHLFKCSYRQTPGTDENHSAGIIECLYLYRQYESEAIRILMPRLSLTYTDQQTQSFVAAMQLGLKSKFGGKVDHLNITVTDEPIPGSTERVAYLVLYDTVPGGTGYLHTLLTDPTQLMSTLRSAFDIMAACQCQHDPDRDGCYNCLYAYKNSYGMENTSRQVAMSLLAEILDDGAVLEKIDKLDKVSKNVWADSELENRFPDAIQSVARQLIDSGIRIRITKDIIKGKVGFKLEINELIYSVEPHVLLRDKDGVAYPCEPDFLISLDRANDSPVKIAVFLDGYKYHKDIVQEDLMKRQGIFLQSGMLTWSLTWHDINQSFAANENKIPNPFKENIENAPWGAINAIGQKKQWSDHAKIAELKPLPLLLHFLCDPDIEKWRGYSMLRAFAWLDQAGMQNQVHLDEFQQNLSQWPAKFVDLVAANSYSFCWSHEVDLPAYSMKTYIAGSNDLITKMDPRLLVLATVFEPRKPDDEITQRAWQKLLQMMNLGQFLPSFFAGTQKGISLGSFSQLSWGTQAAPIVRSEWDNIHVLVSDEAKDIVQQLASTEIPCPQVGYELLSDKSVTIAEAELAWESHKIALLLEEQWEDSHLQFVSQGWNVFVIKEDIVGLIDCLQTAHKGVI